MQPVLVTLAGFAALSALLAWSRWLGGRRWASLGHSLLALALGATVLAGRPLAGLLETYEVLVPSRPVAQLFFERIGPSRYRAALTRLPGGRMQVMDLSGDEWRIDLRLLDWSEGAARLGATPRYRIEALVSRPAAARAPVLPLGTTADLSGGSVTLPHVAALGSRRGRALLETRESSGPWRPMADGARFEVTLAAGGSVEVGPLNAAAEAGLAAR